MWSSKISRRGDQHQSALEIHKRNGGAGGLSCSYWRRYRTGIVREPHALALRGAWTTQYQRRERCLRAERSAPADTLRAPMGLGVMHLVHLGFGNFAEQVLSAKHPIWNCKFVTYHVVGGQAFFVPLANGNLPYPSQPDIDKIKAWIRSGSN